MRMTSHNTPNTQDGNRPEVTVFCAVWHKQDNKLELLKSHWENLKKQTIPVEPCYIFDNGDTAPDWLDAPWHTFDEPLTIYEAWSAAVELSKTRYVMNLNMDDRLSTDCAELLLKFTKKCSLSLACGEWRICFDTEFHTESFSSSSTSSTQFTGNWPPIPSDNLRLGSGTGERGTYGPATLWDLEKTGRWYPCYFGNGDPILSIGDSVFWTSLARTNHSLGRLPLVIGRYYSSPNAQAEFRPNNDAEKLAQHQLHTKTFGQVVAGLKEVQQINPLANAPRNVIETRTHSLAHRYLTMFGRKAPTSPAA